MKRWVIFGSVTILIVGVYIGFLAHSNRVTREHQAAYQTALEAYNTALIPGTTRGHVEDFLQAKGVPFQRTCCEVGVPFDRAKIGEEAPSLVCNKWYVYIEFKFDGAVSKPESAMSSDTLKKIDLYQNEICL